MKIRNYLIPVFSVLALASCNYEQINTNIYGVTEEGMKTGGLLYGAPFMDMQKLVIPIGSPTESTGPVTTWPIRTSCRPATTSVTGA